MATITASALPVLYWCNNAKTPAYTPETLCLTSSRSRYNGKKICVIFSKYTHSDICGVNQSSKVIYFEKKVTKKKYFIYFLVNENFISNLFILVSDTHTHSPPDTYTKSHVLLHTQTHRQTDTYTYRNNDVTAIPRIPADTQSNPFRSIQIFKISWLSPV